MKSITKEVLKISTFFFILITAFSAFQQMITRIHEQQENHFFGPYRLAISYSVFMISNLFIPSIQKSLKWMMCLGVIGHTFNYTTGIYFQHLSEEFQFIVITLGSIGSGIGDGLLYTAVGRYLHNLCHEYEETQNKGKYFGIFSMFAASGILACSFIIFFFLALFSNILFFICLTIIGLLSFIYGVLVIKNVGEPQKNIKQYNVKQSFINILRYYPKMFSILSFAVIDGVNLAFSSTTILHLISTESSVRITICYFLGGIGTLVGAYFGGKLCDLYTLKKTGYMVLFTFVCGCMLCVIADLSQSYIFACLAYLNWGFQFTFFESYLLVCCSRFYDGSKESFAIVKQIHCLSFIVYEINSLLTQNKVQVSVMCPLLLLLLIPAFVSLQNLPKQNDCKSVLLDNEK